MARFKFVVYSICLTFIFFILLSLCSSFPYRLGEAVDRTLLNHLLKMFTSLGIYPDSFEKPFLESTSEFYAAEGVRYIQQSDVPGYLKHVEVHLCSPFYFPCIYVKILIFHTVLTFNFLCSIIFPWK